MKKLLLLFSTVLVFGTMAACAESLSMQECDNCIMAPDPCGCAAPIATPCDTGSDVTCKMPICNLCGCECGCPCHKLSKDEIYQKLCLNQCQIDKADALYEKYKCDTQTIRDTLKCELDKLCQLKQSCASECAIDAQKLKVKMLKRQLKCFCKNFEKDFLCILTPDQQNCYRKIKKEEKCKCKCKCKKTPCCK